MIEPLVLSSDFKIIVDLDWMQPDIPIEMLNKIDATWDEHKKRCGDMLYDSPILSLDKVTNDYVKGHFISYKLYLASKEHPEIRQQFNIQPIGISAITVHKDDILIGRRSSQLANFPNYYELAPSGGIDSEHIIKNKIDYRALILKELEEETQISAQWVRSINPIAIFHSKENNIFELAIHLALELPKGNTYTLQESNEYSEIFWLDFFAFPAFLELNYNQFVPLSIEIWRHFAKGFHSA